MKGKIIIKELKENKRLEAIKEIRNYNNTINYSSLYGMITSKGNGLENFESEKNNQNVYALRKQNKII